MLINFPMTDIKDSCLWRLHWLCSGSGCRWKLFSLFFLGCPYSSSPSTLGIQVCFWNFQFGILAQHLCFLTPLQIPWWRFSWRLWLAVLRCRNCELGSEFRIGFFLYSYHKSSSQNLISTAGSPTRSIITSSFLAFTSNLVASINCYFTPLIASILTLPFILADRQRFRYLLDADYVLNSQLVTTLFFPDSLPLGSSK